MRLVVSASVSPSPSDNAARPSLPQITLAPQITLLPATDVLPHTTELPQITELLSKLSPPQITDEPQITLLPHTTELPQITEFTEVVHRTNKQLVVFLPKSVFDVSTIE